MNCLTVIALIAVGLTVGACVQRTNPLAGVPKEAVQEAANNVTISPANVSTVQFKEYGETRQFQTFARWVKATWSEDCKPSSARLAGYSPNGNSEWSLKCAGTSLRRDYVVTIPERPTGNVRVLKCYEPNARQTVCSVVGQPVS